MVMKKKTLFSLFLGSTVMVAGLTISVGATAAKTEIRVLNWRGYGTDEKFATEAFEKQTGIKVVHDYYTSDQEMRTKMVTNPGAYDIVDINTQLVPSMQAAGLLQQIDTNKIPNFASITPALQKHPDISAGGALYAVPWAWGINAYAYNTDIIKDNLTSVDALWDPKYKGRISMRDDAIYMIGLAALATGQDIHNPADMPAIKAKLLGLKDQIRSFWGSEDEWLKGMAAGTYDIGAIWSGGAARAVRRYKLPVKFVIPTEGAITWVDTLTIPATSKHGDAAAQYINYMLSKEFYVQWDTEVGAAMSANQAAVSALPADAFNRAVMGTSEVDVRLRFMKPISDETRAQYLELWQEVKTEFVQ